jgi:hypothetical protein
MATTMTTRPGGPWVASCLSLRPTYRRRHHARIGIGGGTQHGGTGDLQQLQYADSRS